MKNIKALPLLLICLLLCSCTIQKPDTDKLPDSSTEIVTPPSQDSIEAPDNATVSYAGSYEDILSVLTGTADIVYGAYPGGDIDISSGATVSSVSSSELRDGSSLAPEHSVYSGGRLYLVRGGRLIICDDSGVLSETELFQENYSEGGDNDDPNHYSYGSQSAEGLYICGETAVVVTSSYSYSESFDEVSGEWQYNENQLVRLITIDVANPASPSITGSPAQDGTYCGAYANDTEVFVITSMFVNSDDLSEPEVFIPSTYIGDDSELISPSDIAILPENTCSGYTIITCYDLSAGSFSGTCAVLGGLGRLYIDSSAVYMSFSSSTVLESDSYIDGDYTVVDYTEGSTSRIMRFALSQSMDMACVSVDGYPESAFAFSTQGDSLRFGTVVSTQSYGIYTDTENGWSNRKDYNLTAENRIYTISSDMTAVSSTAIHSVEDITSLRFADDRAYAVTESGVSVISLDSDKEISYNVVLPEYLLKYDGSIYAGVVQDGDVLSITMTDLSTMDVVFSTPLPQEIDGTLINGSMIEAFSDSGIVVLPAGSSYLIYKYSGGVLTHSASIPIIGRQSDCQFICDGTTAFAISDTVSVIDLTDMSVIRSFEVTSADSITYLG